MTTGKKCVEEFFEGGAGGHSMAVGKRLPAFYFLNAGVSR
jgi:hypothetical protein